MSTSVKEQLTDFILQCQVDVANSGAIVVDPNSSQTRIRASLIAPDGKIIDGFGSDINWANTNAAAKHLGYLTRGPLLDSLIAQEILEKDPSEKSKSYSFDDEAALEVFDYLNQSGRFHARIQKVRYFNHPSREDWECEISDRENAEISSLFVSPSMAYAICGAAVKAVGYAPS